MNRRIWSLASVVASAGMAQAQLPQAPASLPGTESGAVMTLKTAGQPERRVQILKSEKLPDGKILTEVKDLATGAIFTIADTKPLNGSESATPAAKPNLPVLSPAPATQIGPNPAVSMSPQSQLPTAKPRNIDPLLGAAPMAQRPNPEPATQQYPTLVGKLRENRAAAAAAQTPSPTSHKPQSAISAALFGSYDTAPQQTPTLVGRFSEKSTAPAAVAAGQPANGIKAALFGNETQTTAQTPTLMNKLFGDKPAPVPTTVANSPVRPQTAPPSNLIRPQATSTQPAPRLVMAPAAHTEPVQPKLAPAMETASLTPVSTDARDPNFHVVPPRPMTMKQIEDMVKDLRMHAKPSSRVEAAQALANCPMSGMVEVRQILAEASYRDPQPVVRAHCIELLTKMQYDEPNYRKYIESLINDDEPAVQRAARNALK